MEGKDEKEKEKTEDSPKDTEPEKTQRKYTADQFPPSLMSAEDHKKFSDEAVKKMVNNLNRNVLAKQKK
jgi:uncharacterized protein YejL (UPF0352 family)